MDGCKATTHWVYKQQLATYPAVEVVEGRVVSDRNRIIGGGVTAGIDFAFTLISQLVGPDVAADLQLLGEYDPQPATPFANPDHAPHEMVAAVQGQVQEMTPALIEFFPTKKA